VLAACGGSGSTGDSPVVGALGGPAWTVTAGEVNGAPYASFGSGPLLFSVDVSDPSDPVEAGRLLLPGAVNDISLGPPVGEGKGKPKPRPASPGRPRRELDVMLLRELRARGYGYKRIAAEYALLTGEYICHTTVRVRLVSSEIVLSDLRLT